MYFDFRYIGPRFMARSCTCQPQYVRTVKHELIPDWWRSQRNVEAGVEDLRVEKPQSSSSGSSSVTRRFPGKEPGIEPTFARTLERPPPHQRSICEETGNGHNMRFCCIQAYDFLLVFETDHCISAYSPTLLFAVFRDVLGANVEVFDGRSN